MWGYVGGVVGVVIPSLRVGVHLSCHGREVLSALCRLGSRRRYTRKSIPKLRGLRGVYNYLRGMSLNRGGTIKHVIKVTKILC